MRGYQYNIADELLVDCFSGGGGTSTGIGLATGRIVNIAINHDRAAIEMHERNHPYTTHYCEDIRQVDPREVTHGLPVALAWFSPDCKHFSKAKGGVPLSKNIRGLAWVAVRWAATVHPRVIFLENVEEFMTWGPLKDGQAIKEKAGNTFRSFVNALKSLGYEVEWKVLTASEFGAPTSRKRFYLIARCDGQPIVFPKPTHGQGAGLLPYRTAAECVDFSLRGKSIFNRSHPLAENTLERIARGLKKFVINSPSPFIISNNTRNAPHGINEPLPTITTGNRNYLLTPYITKFYGGEYQAGARIDEPLPTITAIDHNGLIVPKLAAAHICTLRHNMDGQRVNEPLPTITAHSSHHAAVKSYFAKYTEDGKSFGNWEQIRKLLNKYAGYDIKDDEILIFDIKGEKYFLFDIDMRMLEPFELAAAQGFPPDYVLKVSASYSKKAQIARIGNSVCPIMAEVLVRANLPELCKKKKLNTMSELNKTLTA